MQYHSLVLASIFSALAGVAAASFLTLSPLSAVFLIFTGLAIVFAERVHKGKVAKEVLFIAVILTSFGLGVLRYDIKDFHSAVTPGLVGIVASEPELRDNATRFVFKSENGEKVLVSTDLYSPVVYGDRVEIKGSLKAPGVIESETHSTSSGQAGRDFDYAKYLSKDDIYYTMSFAKVTLLSSGHGNKVKAALLKVKQSFVKKIRTILAEPESSLLAGLIVAGKDAMPANILEEFKRAGVVHIVVLSGYNLTIIADFLRRLFSKFSPKTAAMASVTGIILFVLMTGAEATVVRAAIMVLAVILAKVLGRNYSAPRALLVAAFAMVMQNPKILIYDPSFQLSFLATLALIYAAPVVEKYLTKVPERGGVRGMLATTIATQAVVLPYLVYSMGELSLVSLLSNILILLIIPYTMLVGFIATLVAHISAYIALPLSYAAHLMLAWILGVSHFFGNLPYASIKIKHYPFWAVLIVYIAITAVIWRLRSLPRSSAN